MARLLEIENLAVGFEGSRGVVPVLRGVSLRLDRGESLALVGESGCGKSVTGLAIMRLLRSHARIGSGAIRLDGADLLRFSERDMREVRGSRVAMVFQNVRSSLNPIRRVGDTLADIARAHDRTGMDRKAALARVVAIMDRIGISLAEERARSYPSELSGGMCQRIGVAAALACEPELIIADEPTSALDVTTQQLVMDTLAGACRDRRVALIFITHDLALASQYCDRAAVMHEGRIVEEGPASDVFTSPSHPYTRALLDALPHGKASADALRPMAADRPGLPGADGRRP